MEMESERRAKRVWWLFASAIAALCLVLGLLQYSWISEVSIAERERMQASLRGSLQRLSRDFNSELSTSLAALRPDGPAGDDASRESEYLARYERWKETSPHTRLVKRLALAVPHGEDTNLLMLDPSVPAFQPATWPEEWSEVREQLASRLAGEGRGGFPQRGESMVLELPRFRMMGGGGPLEGPRRPMESEWLVVELNADYIRTAMLPELLRRHLGATDYDAAVGWSRNPGKLIFQSDPRFDGNQADATVRLFDIQYENLFRRGGGGPRPFGNRGGGGMGPPPGPPPGGGGGPPPPMMERGQWTLAVRHRAGSLEAVVERGRWRNIGILAGLLVMMLAALGTLIRLTQREQRLAKLQMDFVAGVSHELRTPLSVIRTAAHNLHGGLVSHPSQIRRYGALIRDESERLTGIVEQVLRFAGAQAGRVIQAREPVQVATLVEDALAATARLTDEAGCLVERDIAPDLPFISADPVALKHAVINLVANAAKYGFSGGWIGISALAAHGVVEITVRDRGPGIAVKDQPYIFDAFYRGKKAIEDQVHGTGLGLNLVKRIAEAHEGTVTVKSEPGAGTEFTLRIPAAPARRVSEQDEFADTIDRG
jgi:signal transduction histidine kinase